jgi:Ca2+-binding EF-hand superfamily protein
MNLKMPVIDQSMETSFRQAFAEVDSDGNGQLDKKEFAQFLLATGQDFGSKYIFEIVDSDHSGTISIEEFLRFGRAIADMNAKKDFKRYLNLVFISCDVGKKGTLTSAEFMKFMKYIGMPISFFDRRKAMKTFDTDGNGTFDFDEILGHLNLKELSELTGGMNG